MKTYPSVESDIRVAQLAFIVREKDPASEEHKAALRELDVLREAYGWSVPALECSSVEVSASTGSTDVDAENTT